ncbi:AAA family ATPase [Eggerthellaceae bacterium zg-887]|uniref:UvrD-helicase domain-containing protein n=1 Tax=Xiamenia xianingshaonis TaxID=2682776 RepID=UPI001407E605|nr:UvrD-helicase domain-containing protein [Xiamenia xianingshaonis]NHM15287.1 AAA family ATPase [Xiamenia xianingshaonis]
MAKRIILAAAGAGKTYHICHSVDVDKRNLILAFTHENVFNIQRELFDAFGLIPESTTVTTFDAFVYHNFILPYEPSIGAHFNLPRFISKGITTSDPPRRTIISSDGKAIPNTRYSNKTELSHYVEDGKRYYCATLSELALQVKKGKESLVKRATDRLRLFYEAVFIDEFQDFRSYDYDLIIKIAKSLPEITLVGDYYQHSVSGTNNTGKPFLAKKREVGYSEFIEKVRKEGFEVDEVSLSKSRRCSTSICEFVQSKMGIPISSSGENEGVVEWVNEDIDAILSNDQVMKLVYKGSGEYSFSSMNWSYSKGDTVSSACVVLTDRFENLDQEEFSTSGIPQSTINKLYVALTRSKGNVYLVKASQFNIVKSRYLRTSRSRK